MLSYPENAIEFYLNNISRKKSASTFRQEIKTLRDFVVLLQSIEGLKPVSSIEEVTVLHLEATQTLIKRNGGNEIQNSTVNRKFNTIRHFFKKLEDWDVIKANPMRKVKDLPEDFNVRRPWTDSQFIQVYTKGQPWIQDILFFVKFTGARASSVALLKWTDVDFQRKTISLSQRKGRDGALKKYFVPLLPELESLLKRLQRKSGGGLADYVFKNGSGNKVSSTHISREVRRLVRASGLHFLRLGIHGLRHSVATTLHVSGASTETIRRVLGHSNTKTTERYLHSDANQLREAMLKAFKTAGNQ